MASLEQPCVVRRDSDNQVRLVAVPHPVLLDEGGVVGSTDVQVVRRSALDGCARMGRRSRAGDNHSVIVQQTVERPRKDAEFVAIGTTADCDGQRMQISKSRGFASPRIGLPRRGGPVVRGRGAASLIAMEGVEVDLQRIAESFGFDLPTDTSLEISVPQTRSNSAAFCALIFIPDTLSILRYDYHVFIWSQRNDDGPQQLRVVGRSTASAVEHCQPEQ